MNDCGDIIFVEIISAAVRIAELEFDCTRGACNAVDYLIRRRPPEAALVVALGD